MLQDYVVATSIEEVTECLGKNGQTYQVINGGTDLIVDLKVGKADADKLVDVTKVKELKAIWEEAGFCKIGGGVTFQEVLESDLIAERLPVLAKACQKVGSWQIRNRGTLAGNIVQAQPAADGAIVLYTLDAQITAIDETGTQTYNVPDLYIGPGQSKLDSSKQLITEIAVPILKQNQGASFQRIAKRESLSLPMINVVCVLTADENQIITDAKITAAPIAPTPKRLPETEAQLRGTKGDDPSIDKAVEKVFEEAEPRDSLLRGSGDYRKELVQEMVKRAIHEALAQI